MSLILRGDDTPQDRLLEVIGSVRRRWRAKVALRGFAITGGAALVLLLIAAFVLERLHFSPASIVAFRVVSVLLVAGLLFRWLLWPLRRRVTNEQVALYLEEHEPTLQSTLISALEANDPAASPAFTQRTLELAIERCREIEDGRRVDRRELNRFATALSTVAIAGVALLGFGPPLVRHGADALLHPLRSASAASPYSIGVDPGHATIARGADQVVTAQLRGWDARPGAAGVAQQVEIAVRAAGDSSFQRIPFTTTEDPTVYEVLLFDVAQPMEYFVEADGVRSPLFRLDVADLPYVERIDLEYRFPDYTGLPVEVVEDGGDIVALRGTIVIVRATTTMPVASGRIILDDKRAVPLQPNAAGALEGNVRVTGDGFYTIELTTPGGVTVAGSPRYLIDAIDDRGPSVRISKPGHDVRPTNVEEVFVEASAEDDFGVSRLELVYSVNAGEEHTIPLLAASRPLTEASASHTFFLEEMDLQPGDLVSYFARVTDNGGAGGRTATSDIFFMNVRPFGRDYRQSQQGGGGSGGGGGGRGDNPGELSQRQREIIAATFNLVRDSATFQPRAFAENLNTIALMQDRLREQVTTLRTRMDNRQVTQDSMFRRIADILPLATQEMAAALEQLRSSRPRDGIPPEQRALLHLQRAESLFREVQVSFDQQGGGGGGGATPNAQDLADLFELEREKLRNQYETVQRGERQQAENQSEVDAALEKLRELARRQEQENERLRQQASMRQNQQGGGGSAQNQRQLADDTEEAARQLERLSRQTNQPNLADVARQLQQAADAMRRSAANARTGNSAQANTALEQLEEARRRLERNRNTSLEQQTRDALDRADRLARQQRDIADRMNRLHSATGAERNADARSLIEEKEDQVRDIGELERQLDRLAQGARNEQRDASRRLQEAANSIRDDQLKEKISYSRAFTQQGSPADYSRELEQQITQELDSVRARIAQAGDAISSGGSSSEEALDRLRRLARGAESLQERTNQAADASRRLQRSQDGQQGQPGQPGEPGQQQDRAGQQGQQAGQQGGQQQGGQQQGGQQQGGQQQGGQQQDGQQGGRPAGGPDGSWGGPGGPRNGWAVPSDQARQLRSEVRERLAEAQALRRELSQAGHDVTQLDQAIRDLRRLGDAGVWTNALDVQRLQASLVDGLKQYEFGLRREVLGAGREQVFLSGADEVPEAFRKLVEEYYRQLSRERR
jgi:hypothetical protein